MMVVGGGKSRKGGGGGWHVNWAGVTPSISYMFNDCDKQ